MAPVEMMPPPHMLELDFSCSPDAGLPSCDVSFSKAIFPKMQSTGAWQCASASACHGASTPPLMNDHSATETYDALIRYQLGNDKAGQQYVVPCRTDPTLSAIQCNLATPSECGSAMPLKVRPAIQAVSSEDLQTIKQWLACGAPDN